MERVVDCPVCQDVDRCFEEIQDDFSSFLCFNCGFMSNSHYTENNLDKVKLIDCSWHMPNVKRNAYEEYVKEHIPGAIFFDLEKNSNQQKDLPHNHFLP